MSRPTDETLRRISHSVAYTEQQPRVLAGTRRKPQARPASSILTVEITALHNDYLMVSRRGGDGSLTGDPFPAAKPDELRHSAAVSDVEITGWTTVDTNTARFTFEGSTYEAKVTPKAWAIGDTVTIQPHADTELTVDGNAVVWEVDPGKKHWAAPLDPVS
ncbi:MAG: hypothetical protein AAGE65_13690 [Planctomycetota bacterium]